MHGVFEALSDTSLAGPHGLAQRHAVILESDAIWIRVGHLMDSSDKGRGVYVELEEEHCETSETIRGKFIF